MPLNTKDLKQIKNVVTEAVEPYVVVIQKDFEQVYGRFDRIEKLILEDRRA
ncbi:MAG: hypothetical protein HYT50_02290 [Candidatus Wildermuthbacteria bacterium]|nr:hypothetical protein [Candidatus Wildermuthbacteria bacterium]